MKNTAEDNDYSELGEVAPSADDLGELSKLAQEMFTAQVEVELKEAELKSAQERLKAVSEKSIPELMEKIGVQEFKTKSGIKLEIKDSIKTHISEENQNEAFKWLEDNKNGGLIKRTVMVAFTREQQTEAKKLEKELVKKGFQTVKTVRKVEPATLTSFVKKRLEAGEEVPMKLFGVYQYKVARITAKQAEVF